MLKNCSTGLFELNPIREGDFVALVEDPLAWRRVERIGHTQLWIQATKKARSGPKRGQTYGHYELREHH